MMGSEAASRNFRIFYGWFVVAAAFAVTFVGFGCAYTFSAFVESLQLDFGASRFGVAGVLACRLSLLRPRNHQWPARRPLWLPAARGRRNGADRPWSCGRKRGAQSHGG